MNASPLALSYAEKPTVEPAEIEIMYRFCAKLVHSLRQQDPELIEYLAHTPTAQVEFSKVASILKVDFSGAPELMNRVFHQAVRVDPRLSSAQITAAALAALLTAVAGVYVVKNAH